MSQCAVVRNESTSDHTTLAREPNERRSDCRRPKRLQEVTSTRRHQLAIDGVVLVLVVAHEHLIIQAIRQRGYPLEISRKIE